MNKWNNFTIHATHLSEMFKMCDSFQLPAAPENVVKYVQATYSGSK